MNRCLFILFILTFNLAASQEITQKIRGRIFDSETYIGLPGVNIVIPASSPLLGTTTDVNGGFVLENVPVGRTNLQISFVGYETYYVNELLISSGKEIVLNVPLKESFVNLNAVVVTPNVAKDQAINKMATVSAKTFSVETAQRFAGGMDDPSRLAGAFAGVTPSTVENNEIVIRGNAAKGILWRMEGVEIPTPNHLAGLFSGGGVNTMFNSNMLSNSDFFTGAFPAEYGNALSGVFDINLRAGNNIKKEYAFQIGTYGIDFAAEGPFVKGKQASYLINYRYSTYGLLQKLLPQVTGLPTFSDLSLKLSFPSKRAGVFSLWSINGQGSVKFENGKDTTQWETNMDSYSYDIHYNLTASGLNHRKTIGKNSYLFTTLSASATEYVNKNIYLKTNLKEIPVTNQNEIDYWYALSTYLNHKFSSRLSFRTGLIINQLRYKYDVAANTRVPNADTADFFVKSKSHTYSFQMYAQSKYKAARNLDVNSGLHLLLLGTNQEVNLEPRLGLSWKLSENHRLSFAYGLHSKAEPIRIYIMKVSTELGSETLNKNLDITKAHHLILGYDWNITQNTHLRLETYYQKLFDVPVIRDSSFSMINYNNEMYFSSQLSNQGTGKNIGIDLTLERALGSGFYYLLTTSIFDSKYTGGDAVERNTRYNQNFVFNVLGGKEWQTKRNHTFNINGKFTILGGRRYAPVNISQSLANQYVVYDNSKIYDLRAPTNYYVDISLNYTINKPRLSHSIILQVKNLLLQREFLGHAFNFKSQSVEPFELMIMLPYFSYKILF